MTIDEISARFDELHRQHKQMHGDTTEDAMFFAFLSALHDTRTEVGDEAFAEWTDTIHAEMAQARNGARA